MVREYKVKHNPKFDIELRSRVEDVLYGENLLQVILHVHLLVERAITLKIKEKLLRPEILEEGKFGRWSFHQKLALYVGLCNPTSEQEQLLTSLNRLRNAIAHRFADEEACVTEYLPLRGYADPPTARLHMVAVAMILFFELGIVDGVERLSDAELCLANMMETLEDFKIDSYSDNYSKSHNRKKGKG